MCENKIDFEKLEKILKLINNWLTTRDYLPKIDDNFLRNFIICCDYDLEETKSLIEKCFTLRLKAPEIFKNRDCLKENVWTFLSNSALTVIPTLTKENYSVSIYRFLSDYRLLTVEGCYKGMTLLADLSLCQDNRYPFGTIEIYDLGTTGLMHITKNLTSFSCIKKFMVYAQEGHPLRLKQCHVLNAPYHWGKLWSFLKPFVKPEVAKLLHIHSSYETLYEFVPKDLLPKDYGGDLPEMDDLKKEWLEKLQAKRESFLDDSRWNIDETKVEIKNSDK